MMEKSIYTPKEVCEILCVSKNTLYKMIKENKIAYVRISDRCFRIPQTYIDDYISQNSVA